MTPPPSARLVLGVAVGVAGLIGMTRLVGGAFTGGMTLVAWAVVALAMLGWVGYTGWRTRHSRVAGASALVVAALAVLGLALAWVGVTGAVLALICSLAAFAVVWVHDLPPRRPDLGRFVRVDELGRDEEESE